MLNIIFIFGTLKEGFPNFHVNRGQRIPGDFITVEKFPLYLVGERFSPWLLNSPGKGCRVTGQLFEVDAPALRAMDRLERVGEPDGYRRLRLNVVRAGAADALATEALAYLKNPDQVKKGTIRLGPLEEYTLEHASRYRAINMENVKPEEAVCKRYA